MKTPTAKPKLPSEADSFLLENHLVRPDSQIARKLRKLEQERNEAREQARWAMQRLQAACKTLRLDNVLEHCAERISQHPEIFRV